jgi:hypothetical protein
MSYDTTITQSYVFNVQAKGIVRAPCMEDRDAQEYCGAFLYIRTRSEKLHPPAPEVVTITLTAGETTC